MGLYVISGCARSGTSLMMQIMLKSFGEDRILGAKFPQMLNKIEKKENESEELFQIKNYILNKIRKMDDEQLEKSFEMNPNGFYEDSTFVVSGLYYHPLKLKAINKIEESKIPLIAKIDARGLPMTDPKYIEKIVYILREPHQVAKSQEKLKRNGEYLFPNGEYIDIFKDLNVNTPELFITSSLNAANWFIKNDTPYLIVEYDKLLSNPSLVYQDLSITLSQKFDINDGVIDTKLKRSTNFSTEYDDPIWKDAEHCYQLLLQEKFEELLDYFSDPKIEYNRRKNNHWYCSRYGETTYEKTCQTCLTNSQFRTSLINHANKKNIDWIKEPCSYECGFNIDTTPITIEQSINKNFWVD